MNDKGFTAISNEFLCQHRAEVGPYGILVLIAITNFIGPGESCEVSVSEISSFLGIDRKTTRKSIAALVETGVISAEKRKSINGFNLSTLYRITKYKVQGCEKDHVGDISLQAGDISPLVGCKKDLGLGKLHPQGGEIAALGWGNSTQQDVDIRVDSKIDIRVDKNTSPTEMIKPATFRTVFWDIFQVNVYTDKAMEFERAFDALGASAYRTLLTGWKERGWSPKNQQGMLDVLARGTLDRDVKIDAPAKEAAPRTWTKAEIEEYHAMEREMGWR